MATLHKSGVSGQHVRVWRVVSAALLIAATSVAVTPPACGQESPRFALIVGNVDKRADAALAMMAFSVVPDLAGSYLQIDSPTTGHSPIFATQTGGGFTLGKPTAPFVEGSIGFSRYDPKFIASNGQEQRRIPARWNTIAATGGIGVDIPLGRDLTLRPIFNFSLGHVESDSSAAGRLVEHVTDVRLDFLRNGRLNAYGLGGSLALDYWRFRERYDFEVLLRYTNILLQTFDSSSAVHGQSDAATVSLYSRLRAPTGLLVLRRPLRYVLEVSNSNYVGDQRGLLGFNFLSSVGTGIEIDISAIHSVFSRVRWVVRYFVGEHVEGFAAGIALS